MLCLVWGCFFQIPDGTGERGPASPVLQRRVQQADEYVRRKIRRRERLVAAWRGAAADYPASAIQSVVRKLQREILALRRTAGPRSEP